MMKPVVSVPDHFSYEATVDSHGWRNLAPFAYHHETKSLVRIQQLSTGEVVRLIFAPDEGGLAVMAEGIGGLSSDQESEIIRIARRCFRLDWDLRPFYAAMRAQPGYEWIAEKRLGRILVAPTVWEDLAKTLLTTNTTWAQTIAMVARLCALGMPFAQGGYAFPSPQQISAMSLEELSNRIRAGYRAPYLYELARLIVSGEINLESWQDNSISGDDLYKAVRSLKGFGDYAAGTMLRLLGHFDRLAIDTACRTAYKFVTGSETASDHEIRAYYEPFGNWRGLVMWMDVMRS